MIRCLLSEQSLLLLLQLQGFQRCRCTPEGCHIQFVYFFLFPFNFFPFSENCQIQFALRILSQFSPYSDLQDPDSLRQCWRPELHLFLLFHNRSSSDQDLSKGTRRRSCVKIEFLKLEMNYDANVYTISVYNNGIFQSFQFSVFTFQASS